MPPIPAKYASSPKLSLCFKFKKYQDKLPWCLQFKKISETRKLNYICFLRIIVYAKLSQFWVITNQLIIQTKLISWLNLKIWVIQELMLLFINQELFYFFFLIFVVKHTTLTIFLGGMLEVLSLCLFIFYRLCVVQI